jgi:dipeptidyl aminopeptidase/acylaminoacyl peptidase
MRRSLSSRLSWLFFLLPLLIGLVPLAPHSAAALPSFPDLYGSFYRISPDGRSVIYLSDTNASGNPELHRTSLTGATHIQLSAELVHPLGEEAAIISPNSQWVVYKDGTPNLYSVPLSGGTPIRLNIPLPTGGQIYTYQISPDSQWVVYRATDGSGRTNLYRASILRGDAEQLSVPLGIEEEADNFEFTADSKHVIYRLWKSEPDIYSVPLAGGPSTLLHAGDSWTIANQRDLVIIYEFPGYIYTIPTTGGLATRITPDGAITGTYALSPNEEFIILHHHPVNDATQNAISHVPITGGATTPLSSSETAEQYIEGIWISPNSEWVLYARRPLAGGERGLIAVRPSGANRHELLPPPSRLGRLEAFLLTLTDDSRYAIYESDVEMPGQRQLYRVSLATGQGEKLNPPNHTSVLSHQVSQDERWIVYLTHVDSGNGSLGFYTLSLTNGRAFRLSSDVFPGTWFPHTQFSGDGKFIAYELR